MFLTLVIEVFITEQTELSVCLESNRNYLIYTRATFHVSINSPKMWQLGRFVEIPLSQTFRKQWSGMIGMIGYTGKNTGFKIHQ